MKWFAEQPRMVKLGLVLIFMVVIVFMVHFGVNE